MAKWVGLAERKAKRATAIAAGVDALWTRLRNYAEAHGGRFILFGSVVREGQRYDSDVDILVDFPESTQSDAWRFAETACWDLGLKPDVRPANLCSEAFVARIPAYAIALE